MQYTYQQLAQILNGLYEEGIRSHKSGVDLEVRYYVLEDKFTFKHDGQILTISENNFADMDRGGMGDVRCKEVKGWARLIYN